MKKPIQNRVNILTANSIKVVRKLQNCKLEVCNYRWVFSGWMIHVTVTIHNVTLVKHSNMEHNMYIHTLMTFYTLQVYDDFWRTNLIEIAIWLKYNQIIYLAGLTFALLAVASIILQTCWLRTEPFSHLRWLLPNLDKQNN